MLIIYGSIIDSLLIPRIFINDEEFFLNEWKKTLTIEF